MLSIFGSAIRLHEKHKNKADERTVSFISVFSFMSLFLLHFVLLWKYARNIPFMDDWNLRTEELVNFGIFGLVFGSVAWMLRSLRTGLQNKEFKSD